MIGDLYDLRCGATQCDKRRLGKNEKNEHAGTCSLRGRTFLKKYDFVPMQFNSFD